MCSIQSMQMSNLIALREKYPDLPLMYCGGGYNAETKEALERGFDCDMKVPDIFPAVIHAFQRKGLRAAVWTADDDKMVSWALAMGVDFIESDYLWGLNVTK